ncbi:dihydrodipicolinate synthetase family protein [Grosmannia clavigera kw1407]|uniref:Dihydrodipicolinate synthetase family protein n=1 Tax=Grosmannia clavigera (strain kw1407 / UAMH 11150) TaxID=655863 RepID=F0XML9_GROCL|nr:dihydrodipicolinate synthetase family protein [Grosmannia clavigera kw1407]EFX01421.1 dihydrodipicolinate synthetase family protein [Grosmannia clavigera kw1407]
MSPHNDAPSPSGSYTAGFNRFPFRAPTSTPATAHLDVADVGFESASPLSSSYDSTLPLGDSHAVAAVGRRREVRRLEPGVYVPTVCFFDPETEDVDTDTVARHAVRLARSGVAGLATQGSNGEAVMLTHAERQLVTRTTRVALDEAGFSRLPIIVGCGCQSTRETIAYCHEAWASGGDFALVLPPSYYGPLFASETIESYFKAVADASPIPILIYNYPGGANGVDLSSDAIVRLSAHPNIAGVKLTCGNTGKLARVVAATRKMTSKQSADETSTSPPFLVLAGSADFTVQSLAVGGHGILAGLANIAPKACVRTMELFQKGDLAGARAMQETVAQGDWTAIQGGVIGVKTGMQAWSGYGGYTRHPLPRPTVEQSTKWKEGFRELVMLEKSL